MAQLGDLPGAVMRRRARLHPDQAGRQLGKERQNLPPTHRATQRHCPQCINSMHLKHRFGRIQPHRCNLLMFMDGSRLLALSTTQLWHIDAVRGPSTPSSPWAEGPRGMVQLAWRFLLFQKESALALWYRARTADSRMGTRKTMIVALARKLVIALWRSVTTGETLEGVVLRPAG